MWVLLDVQQIQVLELSQRAGDLHLWDTTEVEIRYDGQFEVQNREPQHGYAAPDRG